MDFEVKIFCLELKLGSGIQWGQVKKTQCLMLLVCVDLKKVTTEVNHKKSKISIKFTGISLVLKNKTLIGYKCLPLPCF